MPQRALHRDPPAAGDTDEHRPGQLDCLAEPGHVIGPVLPRPGAWFPPVGTARAALVKVDHLGQVSHHGELRLEEAVVGAGPAMQQHQSGPLRHHLALGGQTAAFDIEIQPDIIDSDPHQAIIVRSGGGR